MKLQLKWSKLNNEQRGQIKDFYEDDLRRKEIFEHNLNTRTYNVNPYTGNVIFTKDM